MKAFLLSLLENQKGSLRRLASSWCLKVAVLATAVFARFASAEAQTTNAVFQQNANGQSLGKDSCGAEHFASNDNFWSQSAATALDCHSQSFVSDVSNWNIPRYPNGDFNVSIPALPVRLLGLDVALNTLQLSKGASLEVGESNLTITNGSLVNEGTINVRNNPSGAALTLSANTSISGSGDIIVLGTTANDKAEIVSANSATLTQGVSHTIHGAGGEINIALVNNGVVSSDAAVNAGNITYMYLNGFNMTNNGTFKAIDGHTLILNKTNVTQGSSGQMLADNGFIDFEAATVNGGTFNAAHGGSFNGTDVTLTNIANQAPMAVSEYHTNGSLVNNNVISVLGNPYKGALNCVTDTTVSGNGRITMARASYSEIDAAPGVTLTQAAGHTIDGLGTINAPVVNNGIIRTTAGNSTLNLAQSDKINNGLIESTADALDLDIVGVTISQSGGGVISANGGVVALDSANNKLGTVNGGTLVSSNNGLFQAYSAGFNNVTNNADVRIYNAAIGAGPLVNNGTMAITNYFGGVGTMEFTGNTTVSGTGAIVSKNGVYSLLKIDNGFTLTNATGHTISGAGVIRGSIVNTGIIVPTAPNYLIFRADQDGSALANNGGSVQVPVDTSLSFEAGVPFSQASGTIDLQGGSVDIPNGVDLNGGQLVGNGTISGNVRNNGGIISPGHSPGKITINGDYTQAANGSLNIEIGGNTPGAGYDQLVVNGVAALGGTLNITTINGYRPAVGDVFTIISPQSFTGSFAQINATGLSVQANYASGAITVTVTSVPDLLLNISTRLRVLTDDKTLIGGFIITGTEPKKVIIRAIGPSLTGVPGALPDPTLELFGDSGSIAINDDWKQDQQAEIQASGVAPTKDAESAIVRTLNPGNYTAVVRGKNNSVGIGVVEVYDLAQTAKAKLANISSRGFVDTGDNALIGGFIAGGSGGGTSTKVVIRALGPSLSDAGVPNALVDPTLELKDANGSTVRANDNWKDTQQAELEAIGIEPKKDAESALIAALPAGSYTAIVRGKEDTTGIGLVEVYNVP